MKRMNDWFGPVAALSALLLMPAWASAAPNCAALVDPIYHRVNPTTQANLLTASLSEAENAETQYGFTDDRGAPIRASRAAASGLVAVHRLYKSSTGDFVWISNPSEISAATTNYGYADQGTNFYASTESGACTQPVYRYSKGNKHRHAFSQAERDALAASGWTYETISFYAAPAAPVVDTKFTIAVMPDTQQEVRPTEPRNLNDVRFRNRTQWLVDHEDELDLRFVAHSGDVVNWGERDAYQYSVVVDGVQPLVQAGVPFAFTPGNHDTRAVCAGGSACPGESASTNVRLLPLFSQNFNPLFAVSGRYEANKLDNYYTLFEAGGVKWMLLSLELWPRSQVIDWAKSAVQSHPTHNVFVVTHMYLDGNGNIATDNGGYGANSPRFLFDNLIKQYANIRLVFSGHTGLAASREDTGLNGNKIASFMQTFHSTNNPVRLVEIDTAANQVKTWIYAPQTNTSYPEYDRTVTGLNFVH
ncbi:MAG: metallophosphoesterase [Myxococcales bacterium]